MIPKNKGTNNTTTTNNKYFIYTAKMDQYYKKAAGINLCAAIKHLKIKKSITYIAKKGED